MHRLTSIVALNDLGVIGAGNTLPWRIRSDLKFFREKTINNVVIMGRKTYDSLGAPLKNRLSVVVTHGFGLVQQSDNCVVAHSIDEALAFAEMKKTKKQDVFVIGGATMYEQFAPYVDRYLITDVEKSVPDGDVFFSPDLIGSVKDWRFRRILSGTANDQGDEASFSTFELNAKTNDRFQMRRNEAIDAYLSRFPSRSTKAGRSKELEPFAASA